MRRLALANPELMDKCATGASVHIGWQDAVVLGNVRRDCAILLSDGSDGVEAKGASTLAQSAADGHPSPGQEAEVVPTWVDAREEEGAAAKSRPRDLQRSALGAGRAARGVRRRRVGPAQYFNGF